MAVQIRVPAVIDLLANRINVGDTVEFVGKFNATQQALEQFSSGCADYAADLQAVADAVSNDADSALNSKNAASSSQQQAAASASAAADYASLTSADRQAVAADRVAVEQASHAAVDSADAAAIDRQVVEAAKADVTQLANYAGIREVNKDLYGWATFFGDAGLVAVSGADYSVVAGDAVIGGIHVQIPSVVLSAMEGDFVQCSVAWVSDGNGGYLPDVSVFAAPAEVSAELNGVYSATLASVAAGQVVTDQRQVLPHAEQSFQRLKQLIAESQFLPYNPERQYSAGETCYTRDPATGEVSFWQWYSNVESLAGKDPLDPANRHIGWADNTKPFYWVPYTGEQVGMPFYWLDLTAPEWAVMEINVDLPVAVYWRLARRYPDLVSGGVINTGEIRGEFLRVLDQGRGVDSNRAIGSFQDDTTAVNGLYEQMQRSRVTDMPTVNSGNNSIPFNASGQSASYEIITGAGHIKSIDSETRPRNVARPMAIHI